MSFSVYIQSYNKFFFCMLRKRNIFRLSLQFCVSLWCTGASDNNDVGRYLHFHRRLVTKFKFVLIVSLAVGQSVQMSARNVLCRRSFFALQAQEAWLPNKSGSAIKLHGFESEVT